MGSWSERSRPKPRVRAFVERVFVGNIDFAVSERELRDAFEEIGPVASVQILADAAGGNKGCGFVEMSNASDAALAVTSLHGRELRGRALRVMPAKRRTE